jgi:hypothetical protein
MRSHRGEGQGRPNSNPQPATARHTRTHLVVCVGVAPRVQAGQLFCELLAAEQPRRLARRQQAVEQLQHTWGCVWGEQDGGVCMRVGLGRPCVQKPPALGWLPASSPLLSATRSAPHTWVCCQVSLLQGQQQRLALTASLAQHILQVSLEGCRIKAPVCGRE